MARLLPLVASGALALALAGCPDNLTPLPSSQPYGDPQPPALECVPNLDGRIDAFELQPAVGIPVRYRITPLAQTRPVDLQGGVTDGGKRQWRWDDGVGGDAEFTLRAEAAAGRWFAEHFPSDAVAVPSDPGGHVYGVYRHDQAAFWLHGLASAEPDPAEGRTLMVYDEPIALYRFPLEVGREWTSTGRVTQALLRGLPYAAEDTYTVRVTAAGELLLPDFTFQQVLKVSTRVRISPAVGAPIVQRQVGYLFECFGEVARATAAIDDDTWPFSLAIEVRRLGL